MSVAPQNSIAMTTEAVEYVRAGGGRLRLRSTYKHGCCGGRVELVKVEVAAEEPGEGFERVDLSGDIALYAEVGLLEDLGGSITIGLDILFGMKALFVEGADARM
jgi:hypothetical protein